MPEEAAALTDLVWERHPRARLRLTAVRERVALHEGRLDSVVAPLADAEVCPEERARIEALVRTEVTDLAALAECAALPPDHSLRVAARLTHGAFAAVCTGPVDDEAIALEGVSRRSPLAPWKMLVRGIAQFYRGNDAAALQCLVSVDPESAPARLIPAMRYMMEGGQDGHSSPANRRLIAKVQGKRRELNECMERLDQAFAQGNPALIANTAPRAVSLCSQAMPGIAEGLKQNIAVRLFWFGAPDFAINEWLGGPPLKNARFWRMMAQAAQVMEDPLLTLVYWDEFRLHALHEGWFAPESIEESVVLRHMAASVEEANDEWFDPEEFYGHWPFAKSCYAGQPVQVRAAVPKGRREEPDYLRDVDALYLQACTIEPSTANYEEWIASAKARGGAKAAEAVAEAWHRGVPEDPAPLLLLGEYAEERDAFSKALGYIEAAERMDGLNPGVRRARIRLLAACARRHIKAGKPHLLHKDADDLEAMAEMAGGDRPAFVAGLRWAEAALANDVEACKRFAEKTVCLMGSNVAAHTLLAAIAFQHKATRSALPPAPKDEYLKDDAALIDAMARTFALGGETGVAVRPNPRERSKMLRALSKRKPKGNAQQFRAIAQGALQGDDKELAYVAAGAGLALGPPTEAQFLILRAKALPHYMFAERWELCAAAAAHLARKARDVNLAGEAVDVLRGTGKRPNLFSLVAGVGTLDIPERDVANVLRLEGKLRDAASLETGERAYNEAFAKRRSSTPLGGRRSPFVEFLDRYTDDVPDEGEDFDDGTFADDWDEYSDDSQMDMFGEDPESELEQAVAEVVALFPGRQTIPSLDEIGKRSEEAATRLSASILSYAMFYGFQPDVDSIWLMMMEKGARDRRSGKGRRQ